MGDSADLELSLHRRDSESYVVEFRFTEPGSDTDQRLSQDAPALVRFDFDRLRWSGFDPADYSKELTTSLFKDPAVRSGFTRARTKAQDLRVPLRLRLLIGPSAPELHLLRWETLSDPEDGTPLATSENVLFSRYLTSTDWRSIRPLPKRDLNALVFIANPSDLAANGLEPVSVEAETTRARVGLEEMNVDVAQEGGQPATINLLMDKLRQRARQHEQGETYEILYIVTHGSFVHGEPWLIMEDDNGLLTRISGSELVTRLKELPSCPRLVILVSCQSAASDDILDPIKDTSLALAALGPRLAEAGVPAVLAMLGNISMDTIAQFMPVFFRELNCDWSIDRAVAVARGQVRQNPDHWMPALFMRLRSGRLWYAPGFSGSGEQDDFEKWDSLISSIQEGTCTPILGPGLAEALVGSNRDLALRWAEKYGYPFSPDDRDDLPRVAQYLVTRQDPAFLERAFREALRGELLSRHGDWLPGELQAQSSWPSTKLLDALRLAAEEYWRQEANQAFQLLARLPLPIYITANQTDLMFQALTNAGKNPVSRICPWNPSVERLHALWAYDEEPTVEKPLVYHLFGHLREPRSLVLTEDEYFDYMIGMSRNRDVIPSAVRAALASSNLLFLGFQIEEWDFRVIFRSLLAQQNSDQWKFYSHVAAQIEPEEGRLIDPQRARRYLQKYFEAGKISIYWGSAPEFLSDLSKHL